MLTLLNDSLIKTLFLSHNLDNNRGDNFEEH